MRSQFMILAGILLLATLLLGFSLVGAMPEDMLRGQARNCGVVGFISFVGLCLVAGARQGIAALDCQRPDDPAHAAARQSLYETLHQMGLPTDR
jgi:hypothetical protein